MGEENRGPAAQRADGDRNHAEPDGAGRNAPLKLAPPNQKSLSVSRHSIYSFGYLSRGDPIVFCAD